MPIAVVACFLVSGGTSLILQVVWVRELALVFGSSTLAISTVLATFMAGLALGSWLGGALADRLPAPVRDGGTIGRRLLTSPLFYYAICEALIGITALIIPTLIAAYRPINASLWAHLGDHPTLLALVRFALAMLVLTIPTTAMGATLPLLGRYVVRRHSDLPALSGRLGTLYAANTLGAVIGAASAGFLLIPVLGATRTNSLAAVMAVALASLIVLFTATYRRGPDLEELAGADEEPEEEEIDHDRDRDRGSDRTRKLALVTYGLTGAVAMALEVLWSRALAVVIGSSVYSFTLILVVFLLGISTGSAIFGRIAERTPRPLTLLALITGCTAASVVTTHLFIDDLPAVFLALIEGGSMTPSTTMAVHIIIAGITIIPGAIGLGAIMPVAIRCYAGDENRVGRDVGRAYATNTFGAIVGSIAGGILIMPWLGVERGVLACAIALAATSAMLLASGRELTGRVSRFGVVVVTATVTIAVFGPRWDASDFTTGVFRTHLARHYLEEGELSDRNVVYYADGMATTVTVEQRDDRWILKNNGKTEASNKTDMPTQILVGLLPVLTHGGDDLDVFVIGYGSGVTIGAITQAPTVSNIEVVELEPRVLEAADRFFGSFNNQPEHSDKVTRHIGDGRDVLLAGGKQYDVIVSEPSNPWMAGIANLFTREFYRFAQSHLKDDGIFCQWAQLYELGPRNVKMIYATFAEAFPYVYAFTPGDGTSDTILIGSRHPLRMSISELATAMSDRTLAAELERANVHSAEQLVASFMLGPDEIAAFTAGADINTDDNGKLEYSAPLDLLRENYARLAREVRTIGWPYGRLASWLADVSTESAATLAEELVGYGRYREARSWVEYSQRRGDGRAAKVSLLIDLAAPVDYLDPELPVTAGGRPLPPPSAELFESDGAAGAEQLKKAYGHLVEGEWAPGWQSVRNLPPRTTTLEGRDVDLLRAYFAYKSLNLRRARTLFRRLNDVDTIARRPAVLYYRARTLLGLGDFTDGKNAMLEFIERYPELARTTAASRL